MLRRLTRAADFERALAEPARARSAHFAVHFVAEAARGAGSGPVSTELSTTDEQISAPVVDDSVARGVRLGAVVPKRHARRAVTRSLIKREIRAAAARQGAAGKPGLAAGIWVVRLRAAFDRAQFVSAASAALRKAARGELDAVFDDAPRGRPGAGGSAP